MSWIFVVVPDACTIDIVEHVEQYRLGLGHSA
jgi:hypothetical protein